MFLNLNNIFSCPEKKKPINDNNPQKQKIMNNNNDDNENKDEKDIFNNNKKEYKDDIYDYNKFVFQDTKNKCKNDEFLKRIIADSINSQHFYKENEKIDINYKDKIKNNEKNTNEFQK